MLKDPPTSGDWTETETVRLISIEWNKNGIATEFTNEVNSVREEREAEEEEEDRQAALEETPQPIYYKFHLQFPLPLCLSNLSLIM